VTIINTNNFINVDFQLSYLVATANCQIYKIKMWCSFCNFRLYFGC